MRRNITPISLLFLLALAGCSSNPVEPKQNYVPGEVMAHFRSGTTEASARALIAELDLEWKEYFEHLGIALLGVPVGEEQDWIEELEQQPLVVSAQLNHTNITLR